MSQKIRTGLYHSASAEQTVIVCVVGSTDASVSVSEVYPHFKARYDLPISEFMERFIGRQINHANPLNGIWRNTTDQSEVDVVDYENGDVYFSHTHFGYPTFTSLSAEEFSAHYVPKRAR